MKILFIDDELVRFRNFQQNNSSHDILWVQTPDAAIQALTNEQFAIVCWDHDLGVRFNSDQDEFPDTTTVIPILNFIQGSTGAQMNLQGTVHLIHSSNPVGVENIISKLKGTLISEISVLKTPGLWNCSIQSIPGVI